jgi:hypothetical protein
MAEKKITKKEKFEMLLEKVADNEMLTEFINHEIELLTNKSSKGSAKKNEEHEAFFEVIRDILSESADVNGMRCNAIATHDLAKAFEWADKASTSPQRVSAMLKKMIANGDVEKVIVKGDSYFRLV